MKTSSRKAKGRNAQKKVVAKLLKAFPELNDRDIKSTSMGAQGVDIQLSSAAFKRFPFATEVKAQEIHAAFIDNWIQTTDNTKVGELPLLIITCNRKPLLAVIKFDALLGILNETKKM